MNHNLYFQISKSHINYRENFQVCKTNFQLYTSDSLGSYASTGGTSPEIDPVFSP